MALNGSISYSSPIPNLLDPTPNGFYEPPEVELPVVDDGQVQLRDLVSRVVQACYAEMTEMAET
jgi:mediator of RNA polymerase II transcription subunit 14